jgi:serine/threonine protein kinase
MFGSSAFSPCLLSRVELTLSQMKPGVFREEYIAIIVRELLRGLDYLHTEGKLHRDIKGISTIHPQNF